MMAWTWRHELRLLTYNYIKRPWLNFHYWLPWGESQRWARKTRGRPFMLRAGKMTRADVEWAHNSAIAYAKTPLTVDNIAGRRG